jgi:hypothetical protein
MSEGTKLMAIKDSASALVVSAVLLTTGVGLFRLKSWARVTAQFFCALYVAVTVHSLAWGFRGLGEDGWPEPPFWIGLLVILAPFVFGILASLALPFAVLLQSKRAKECFG